MKYTTIAVLSLQSGVVLGLTGAQAGPRMHALEPVPDRKAWYTTTAPVQFKVGEVFLCDDLLPKNLVCVTAAVAKAPPRVKAAADSAAVQAKTAEEPAALFAPQP